MFITDSLGTCLSLGIFSRDEINWSESLKKKLFTGYNTFCSLQRLWCTFNRKAYFLYVLIARYLQHARDDITHCNIVLRQIANTWFTRYWRSRYTGWAKLLIWLLICTKNTEYDSYRLEFISKLLILIYLGSAFANKKGIAAKGFTSDFWANFCQSRSQ